MVALSLYRGNLHRVPDVPRRWLMPTRTISLKDFKLLLHRRSKALSRRASSAAAAVATHSNPDPNAKENGIVIAAQLEENKGTNPFGEGTSASKIVQDQQRFEIGKSSVKGGDLSNSSPAEKPEVAGKGNEDLHSANPNLENTGKADAANDIVKRKKEVEEKLEVLNGKKHNLVQMLKQILHVEEELKRRNNVQGIANCSPAAVQVDVSNDSGSVSRNPTPRLSSETIFGGDMERGESEDALNHNNNSSRLIHQTSSASPSSESPLRKPPNIQQSMVFHPSRPSLGTISSPSRFASTGHPGPSPNVPTVSVSGTNYVASSPSPAASGGTSAFRDARQPSPWS